MLAKRYSVQFCNLPRSFLVFYYTHPIYTFIHFSITEAVNDDVGTFDDDIVNEYSSDDSGDDNVVKATPSRWEKFDLINSIISSLN